MSYPSSPSSGWTLDDSELPPLSETWEDNLQEPTWKEFLIPSLFHEETPDRPTPRPPLSSNIVNTQSTYTRSSHISDPAQCDTLSTEPDSYNFNAPTVPDDDWTKLPTTICPLDLLPPGSELRERTLARMSKRKRGDEDDNDSSDEEEGNNYNDGSSGEDEGGLGGDGDQEAQEDQGDDHSLEEEQTSDEEGEETVPPPAASADYVNGKKVEPIERFIQLQQYTVPRPSVQPPPLTVECGMDGCTAVLSLGNVGLALGHWREHFKTRGRTDNQSDSGLCGYRGCIHSNCYTQLLRHWQLVHLKVEFECPVCSKREKRDDVFKRHLGICLAKAAQAKPLKEGKPQKKKRKSD